MTWKRCWRKWSRPNRCTTPELAWPDGGTLLKTSGQPMTSKDSNRHLPDTILDRKLYINPFGVGLVSSRQHLNTISAPCPQGSFMCFYRLLRINNYLEASFLMGYDITSAGNRTPTFRLRVMDPWSWGQNVLPKRRYQITQWRSIISQNNRILGYTTGKPSCFPEQH
jgi:hypothetical protein